MTVSIVPSTGSFTAIYATSLDFSSAIATSSTNNFSFPIIPFKNPVIICDKIVPEFPLAPIRTASSTTSISSCIVLESFTLASNSSIMAFNVIAILLPVSPSGTGYTFNSFNSSSCLITHFPPPINNSFNLLASKYFIPIYSS